MTDPARNFFVKYGRNPYVLFTLLCALLFAPFSNKAFHIDSPVTVYVTQQMLIDIVNPPLGEFGHLLAPWNHTDLPESSVFYITPHPPLVSLYLMPVVALFGKSERALNWAMFPFYLFSVLIFFKLATLFVPRWKFESTLLFCVCPVVFINSQNVMLDVPLMSFTMAAFYFLFRSGRSRDALWAGLFATLACLTKFTGGTVVLSGLCYFAFTRKWKGLIVFLAPFVALYGLWTVLNVIVLGKIALISNGHAHYILGDLRYRLERLVSYFGGTIAFPLFPFVVALAVKKYRRAAIAFFLLAALWSVALYYHLHYSVASAAFYALCAASGAVLIYGIAGLSSKDSRNACLSIHFGLQVVGGLFLTLYASRYLLPIVFIGVLFYASFIDRLPVRIPRRPVWAVMIVVSAFMSLVLSMSDFQLVNAERRVAQDVRKLYPDKRVCFSGRLGYLYYMNKAGCTSLTVAHDPLKAGDILVQNCAFGEDAEFFAPPADLTLVRELHYPLLPLRTMTGRAGFYGNDRLPYAWVGSPADRVFRLFRCN